MMLISLLILWASAACSAMSGEKVGLDILGSEADNATIISPYGTPIDVDIIGSTASNIRIGYPEEEEVDNSCCDYCGRDKCYTTPWDDFRRPLCYPWSSYIPTRYNRPFIKTKETSHKTPSVITLGGFLMPSG
jgi:hypothetical protein